MTIAPDTTEGQTRADRPVPFVPVPENGLRSFRTASPHWVWFVGAHGGAGETTLAGLLPEAGEGDHRWPVHLDGSVPHVVLIARTSAAGLLAARTALAQWAAGDTPPVRLLGLVLSPDASGRTPKPLRQLAELVAGGVRPTEHRKVWHLPWVDEWRTGDQAGPKPTARLFRDIADLTS